ncbi:type 2 isopentenyl-diphosphate Delta-isomerase [Fructobacillus sp. M2-14]|uniref:Isopentenyl-diphosphate delta-isomerase n=1 Tax=Fructobacillus broussonetiae TaxID=2713173 RepID=A0ABS5R0Y2_9LACO|nr:type 2 isopentenyl-diphosphate Delta-isomerase [Fructobacillus broussonetiae]MBS9339096.1 type 2 isopentenyl-diphosphate Delta-isomerase [Fructobacillus broussonetiae]
MTDAHSNRKNEHLSLATKFWRDDQKPVVGASFDDVRWVPGPLNSRSVETANTQTSLLGESFEWPFYIEAMTGGSESTKKVNEQLATVAEMTGIAMAVGSQSVALKDPDQADSFKIVREKHPNGFLIANLGADHPIENVKKAVEMIDANAIEIHVNVGQELSMAEGDRSFNWLDNLKHIIEESPVPVIIKEVGFGMGVSELRQLAELQPAAINIGGGNGTSFYQIEQARDRKNEVPLDLSSFGLSTVESLLAAQKADIDVPIIATGGIESAKDVTTALMLGASAASSAGYFLSVLMQDGQDALEQIIRTWQQQLPKYMTLLGASDLSQLPHAPRLYSGDLMNTIDQL